MTTTYNHENPFGRRDRRGAAAPESGRSASGGQSGRACGVVRASSLAAPLAPVCERLSLRAPRTPSHRRVRPSRWRRTASDRGPRAPPPLGRATARAVVLFTAAAQTQIAMGGLGKTTADGGTGLDGVLTRASAVSFGVGGDGDRGGARPPSSRRSDGEMLRPYSRRS